jgi:DNA-binding response OmpR family regulator
MGVMSEGAVPGAMIVLLAEDEDLIRELVGKALEEGGFQVVVALDGEKAMAAMADEPSIQALVADIRLGSGPDGWEVARRAREINGHLAVVYMSGDSAADWPVKGVPNSVMVQKPFAPAQIVTAVASLVNLGQPLG